MLESLSPWLSIIAIVASAYAVYTSQRAKIHTYWNQEEIQEIRANNPDTIKIDEEIPT